MSRRRALRLNADYAWALERLVQCSRTREEKRAALAFAAAEMERQVMKGDGLATWRLQALAVLEPEEVRAHLEQAHQAPSLPVPRPANDATREKQIPFRFLSDRNTLARRSGIVCSSAVKIHHEPS